MPESVISRSLTGDIGKILSDTAMSMESEDAELENVLQQLFMECDTSMLTSTPNLTILTDDAVPVSRIIQDRLSYVSDADSSMKTMDIVDLENVKFRELYEENNVLRDELESQERLINNVKQQHNILEKQLKHYVQKCQQLEKDNDEQREQLNELLKNEKTMTLALQRYTKEHQNLLKRLEAAEIEILAIPSLKEKLEKITKEKMDCLKLIAKIQEEFDEKENNCSQLKTMITELEDTSISMKEDYEYMIQNLREKNRKLTDENMELQSLSIHNTCSPGERLSLVSDTDEYYMHSTPYKSIKVSMEDSLYTELKASGFTTECSRNDIQELEEELNEYDTAIFTISEQLEKIIQFFVTMRGSVDDLPHFTLQNTDEKSYINTLRHKISILLNMVTKEITRRNTRQDSSTQLRVEPANATSSLKQFGIRSFWDLLPTHAIRPKVKASLRSITHCANNEDNDLFSRIIKTYPGVQNRFRIIEPLIEELHDIIESTLSAFVDRKDCPLTENSRYRSIHTLPSSLQSLQSSLLTVENSRQTFGYSKTNVIDTLFARGDSLIQKDHNEKSTSFTAEAHDVSNQENPARFKENRLSEMSKVSNIFQMDSKAMSEEIKRDCTNEQVPEVSSASNSLSPRRKISVYCRSFDVVAMQDSREDHQGSNLEVRHSLNNPDNSPVTVTDCESSIMMKHAFNHVYRNRKSDSDSTNSTPGKQFEDSLLDDEPSVEQTILRKVHLAPTRLKFPLETRNDLHRTIEASPVLVNSTKLDISNSSSPIDEHKKDDNDDFFYSSSFINKCKMKNVFGSTSCLNKNVLQTQLMSNRCLFLRDQNEKIVDSEDPHSQMCVQRVGDESQLRIERSVDSQMSSCEDSLTISNNGVRESAAGFDDRCSIDKKIPNEIDKANVTPFVSLINPVSTKVMLCKNAVQSDEKAHERNLLKMKPQLSLNMKRSYSEGENLNRLKCHCKRKNTSLIPEGRQHTIFPSLTDIRLQKSGGIVNVSDAELEIRENSSELELQKRYTAFSLCLCIDRLTLPRRIAISLRQRDQSEKNLSCEVQKMQQDIQELAPLCTDRESVERVERVRHQLDMIVRCAHRVSCAAETLGAVHQERRVSRAVLLADKYLQVLHSRCEKLIANVVETKRILVENNIVMEENSGELNDELPRIRYRSGITANNRMMMAKRRASVATMSRPIGNTQDVTKDTVRQRKSVSGRMTLRRPSFSSIEKLDHIESSNSISELRGIFEQAESCNMREENNNMLRLNHSNSQSTVNCAIIDNEDWTSVKEEVSSEVSDNESINSENRSSARSSHSFQLRRRKRRILLIILLFIILILFFIFYIYAMLNVCQESLNKRLIGYVFDGRIRNAAPHPM